jgi:RNA polymerase sigma-70 factor (ECF subfamily)
MNALVPGLHIEEHAKREPDRAKHQVMSTATLSDVNRAPLTEELDQIFREHHLLVYRTAYGVTGSREDAQDIVQTIFLRLLKRECPPDLMKNPKAYLYRAAVNASLNTIRSRRHHVQVEDAKSLEKAAVSSEAETAEELHQRLYSAIAKLDPESGQILILRYVHGYSIADIAKLLGKSSGLIACWLFRARARLKRHIHAPLGEKR